VTAGRQGGPIQLAGLNFRKVDKPFMFMVILTMGKYATLPQEQLGVKSGSQRSAA